MVAAQFPEFASLHSGLDARCVSKTLVSVLHNGTLNRISCHDVNSFRSSKYKDRKLQLHVVNALPPEAISAAATVLVVGASVAALIRLNSPTSNPEREKTKCEACNGSGLCCMCNGEGFVLKNLSAEQAAKARATATTAATRNTAGLAKKWNYCLNCSGTRKCPTCQGRGDLNAMQMET